MIQGAGSWWIVLCKRGLWNGRDCCKRQDVDVDHSYWSTTCLIVPLFSLIFMSIVVNFCTSTHEAMCWSWWIARCERGLWKWTDDSEREDVGVDLSCWSTTCLIVPFFPWISCERAYNQWYKSAEADGLRTKWVRFLKGICCKRQNVVVITAGEALHVSHLGPQRQSECSCWVLRTVFWTYAALSPGQP